MDLHEKKLELFQLILNTDRPGLLETVSEHKEPDWWDDLPESVQQAIENGNQEAERGETRSHEEFMREVRSKP